MEVSGAFELTGGYSLSIALLLTVSISVGINQALHGRSFFQWQLEMRGHNVEEGPHYQLMESIKAKQILLPLDEDEKPEIDDEDATPLLTPESSLRQVLRAFDESGVSRLRVVANNQRDQQIGWITHVDALRLFNNLLIDTSDEEHK